MMRRNAILNKKNRCEYLYDIVWHDFVIFICYWPAAEPLGSTEPRLKITGVHVQTEFIFTPLQRGVYEMSVILRTDR